MPSRLSKVKTEDWKAYRRVARYYERELRRIYQATACPADALRRFAHEAIYGKPKMSSVFINGAFTAAYRRGYRTNP